MLELVKRRLSHVETSDLKRGVELEDAVAYKLDWSWDKGKDSR